MNIEQDMDHLKRNLSLHLRNLMPAHCCGEMIARHDDARGGGQLEIVKKELIEACRERVFTNEFNMLLTRYFNGPFTSCWSTFDVTGSAGAAHNRNAHWLLDGGFRGMHKLFIYLNSVAEHGGNTVMVDTERTQKLREGGALPIEYDQRKEDMSEFFEKLEISPELHGESMGSDSIDLE